jgi:hypothetical protein
MNNYTLRPAASTGGTMKEPNLASGGEVCADCGLRTGPGEPNCAALRDALLARDFEQPALYWKFHRMAIDAYCVQHAAYVESAKIAGGSSVRPLCCPGACQ